MRSRIFSLMLVVALFIGMCPTHGFATESDTIFFDDGSYIVVRVEDVSARATNVRSGNKYLTYYDGSDNVEWEAKLTGSFTYNGTSATCTSASCTVTIYENAWYEISNTTTRSGNTATTQLTMGEKFLGITISKPQYTITLTCDKDGNLS